MNTKFNLEADLGVDPMILGNIFQNTTDQKRRRELGGHYTDEKNILKTLNPLIFDELRADLENVKNSIPELERLHERIVNLHFLDPAAGCGNFLVIAYRELRKLERDIHAAQNPRAAQGTLFDAAPPTRIRLENFHGIEIEELPAKIAEAALHLEQRRQDRLSFELTGSPPESKAHIVRANAATTDWNEIVAASDDLFIVGNPPYIGTRMMNPSQKIERDTVWRGVKRSGKLDYVTIWFKKAADHIKGTKARVAFVSTNSVHQGEQVSPFWGTLRDTGMVIDFAHRPFSWANGADGTASVHVVIVGFSWHGTGNEATLYDYPNIYEEPIITHPPAINAYLTGGSDVIIARRSKPLSNDLAILHKATEFTDGAAGWHGTEKYQGLILDEPGYREAMADPIAGKYVRQLTGADEFIKGNTRWCMWLVDADAEEIHASVVLRRRVEFVEDFRGARYAPALPSMPVSVRHRFDVERYLIIPVHTTQVRDYFISGFVPADTICTNSAAISFDASLLDFAVISSRYMRIWSETVSGRIGSGLRFGNETTWNTFPLPALTEQQRSDLTASGQAVLDVRAAHPGRTMADLYGPGMPDDLVEAHRSLDRGLDAIFGLSRHAVDAERLGRLIDLYSAAIL